MTEPVSKFVEVRGKMIFYDSYEMDTAKPTIVLLHDSLGCVQLWRDFPRKIAEQTQMNVMVYDRIGYGKSHPMDSSARTLQYMEIEADILIEILGQLQIHQPILLGHSDGGSIALIAAGKYPQRIHGLILEAAHIYVEELTLQGISDAKYLYDTSNLKQRLEKYHGNKVEVMFDAWTQTWLTDWFKAWNIEHFLPAIQCPLLFIQGDKDEYGTIAQVDETLAQVSGKSEKCILKDVGHTPHKEAPVETLHVSASWILNTFRNSVEGMGELNNAIEY